MEGQLKKIRNANGQYVFPITHADGVYVEANKSLTQKLSELGSGGNVINGTGGNPSIYSYYEPKPEQNAELATSKVYKGWTVAQYYEMYDGLMATNPKYITKHIAPYKDMSGQHDLVRYVYTPEDGYDKTIYIGAGVHANEMASKLTIARICQLVCEEWRSSPHLEYLRKRVRMIIIPIINPWGHATKSMLNSNKSANPSGVGVNCNRNYDGFWVGPIPSSGSDHNGAHPFSENEIKWVRDTILEYGSENIHYGFDCHDAGTSSVQGDFWINYNTFHKTSLRVTRPLNWYLGNKYITDREPFIWHDKDTTTGGVFPVWAGKIMGFPASTVEHCYPSPSTPFDSNFMTRAVDTYLNAILVNTIADHKTPVFNGNKKWFGLEWWKAAGDYSWTTAGLGFDNTIAHWESLVTKYPKYMKKSATYFTTSDGKQAHHYILEPKKYSKTILVMGGRIEPNKAFMEFSIAMLRFADLICQHAYKDEHLMEIRDNTRIVFIPLLEYNTSYLNSYGNFSELGVPDTTKIPVANIVNLINSFDKIDGVIYSNELNTNNKYSALVDDTFVLASQDTADRTHIESYVDHLNSIGVVAEFNRSAVTELANFVVNQKSIPCVRIDSGVHHAMYELKKFQFDDQYGDTEVNKDLFMKYNSEVARRVTHIANVIKLINEI